MEYPECLNGRCTYNEDYRCKAEGITEDIICLQGKDDAATQGRKAGPGDDDLHRMITGGRDQETSDKEKECSATNGNVSA